MLAVVVIKKKNCLRIFTASEFCHDRILNTYRTAVSPTLDLLCHEDFNVGRSEN